MITYVYISILNRRDKFYKFELKSDEGFFVRYSRESKSYRVYNLRLKIVEESPNVDFNERDFPKRIVASDWLFEIDVFAKYFNADYLNVAGYEGP